MLRYVVTLILVLLQIYLAAGIVSGQSFDRQRLMELSQDTDRLRVDIADVRLTREIQADPDYRSGRYHVQTLHQPGTKLPHVNIQTASQAGEFIGASHIHAGGHTLLTLSGSNQTAAIWDADSPRTTHQEFGTRISFVDSISTGFDSHATRVSGVMMAEGQVSNAMGTAPALEKLRAWNWDNDTSDMADEAAGGLNLSTHPYEMLAGWTYDFRGDGEWVWYSLPEEDPEEAYQFGYYDSRARNWDDIIYHAPEYLITLSAGNQRGRVPDEQPVGHWTLERDGDDFGWIWSTDERPPDGGADGYTSITASAVSKNVLVVGGVDHTLEQAIYERSGFGPTDDGRIKPDLAAPAVSLYAPDASSDTDYRTISGTSAAVGVAAGAVALLQQHYTDVYSEKPSAATLRALLIQTTDSFHEKMRPDYRHGWGVLNAERAARFLSASSLSNPRHILKEKQLPDGETLEKTFYLPEKEPGRVTIAWTDPPGPELSISEKDTPVLVNDLDLEVIGPDNTVHYPWTLDKDNPDAEAVTGNNDRDNVEQVWLENPEGGVYTVRVTHKGSLEGGGQMVSILAGPAEPYILAETTSSGKWSDETVWNTETVPDQSIPDGSLFRTALHHSVELDSDKALGSVESSHPDGYLSLQSHNLKLYRGQHGDEAALAGTYQSRLELAGWSSESGPLRLRDGSRDLAGLIVSAGEEQTVFAGSGLNIHSELNLQSGNLDTGGFPVVLKSDAGGAASILAENGSITGDISYDRYYGNAASGWRFMSSPLTGNYYSSLRDDFHTQGGSWAEYELENSEEEEGLVSNLWHFNPEEQQFEAYYGTDTEIESGSGFLFYQFEETTDGESVFPALWRTSGSEVKSEMVQLHWNGSDADNYFLAGNPFAAALDWEILYQDSRNIAPFYTIWDPELTTDGGSAGYRYYHIDGTGTAGRNIAPAQGFFVESTDSDAELRFETKQKVTEQAGMYGKEQIVEPPPFIRIQMTTPEGGLLEPETWMVFYDSEDDLPGGIERLVHLDSGSESISLISDSGKRLAFDYRFINNNTATFRLHPDGVEERQYRISWPEWNRIPDERDVVLTDRETGRQIDMRQQNDYLFVHTAPDSPDEDNIRQSDDKKLQNSVNNQADYGDIHQRSGNNQSDGGDIRQSSGYNQPDDGDIRPNNGNNQTETGNRVHTVKPEKARFEIKFTSRETAGKGESEQPDHYALEQNYPNPFNSKTTIRYHMPEAGPVSLDIYDMLGRKVTTLVDGHQEAGIHDVGFHASGAASGIYIYRLHAGGVTFSKKLTIIK